MNRSPWFDSAIVDETYVFPRANVALVAVPKNACTSLKASLLAAEGVTTDGLDSEGVHRLASEFRMMTSESLAGRRTLIALRNPFTRLRSAYFDKFVLKPNEDAENVIQAIWKSQRGKQRVSKGASVSFSEFIGYLRYAPNHTLDLHYRPQIDFFWLSFSHVVLVDEPGHLESTLGRLGVLPVPAPDGNATSSRFLSCPPDWGAQTDGAEWRRFFEQEGGLPPVEQLLTPWLFYRIRERFADDFSLVANAKPSES